MQFILIVVTVAVATEWAIRARPPLDRKICSRPRSVQPLLPMTTPSASTS
jgi:hypothetical protein